MKLICSKASLLKGVSIVSKAVPSRTTMPILNCILIDASANEIKLTANDMESDMLKGYELGAELLRARSWSVASLHWMQNFSPRSFVNSRIMMLSSSQMIRFRQRLPVKKQSLTSLENPVKIFPTFRILRKMSPSAFPSLH